MDFSDAFDETNVNIHYKNVVLGNDSKSITETLTTITLTDDPIDEPEIEYILPCNNHITNKSIDCDRLLDPNEYNLVTRNNQGETIYISLIDILAKLGRDNKEYIEHKSEENLHAINREFNIAIDNTLKTNLDKMQCEINKINHKHSATQKQFNNMKTNIRYGIITVCICFVILSIGLFYLHQQNYTFMNKITEVNGKLNDMIEMKNATIFMSKAVDKLQSELMSQSKYIDALAIMQHNNAICYYDDNLSNCSHFHIIFMMTFLFIGCTIHKKHIDYFRHINFNCMDNLVSIADHLADEHLSVNDCDPNFTVLNSPITSDVLSSENTSNNTVQSDNEMQRLKVYYDNTKSFIEKSFEEERLEMDKEYANELEQICNGYKHELLLVRDNYQKDVACIEQVTNKNIEVILMRDNELSELKKEYEEEMKKIDIEYQEEMLHISKTHDALLLQMRDEMMRNNFAITIHYNNQCFDHRILSSVDTWDDEIYSQLIDAIMIEFDLDGSEVSIFEDNEGDKITVDDIEDVIDAFDDVDTNQIHLHVTIKQHPSLSTSNLKVKTVPSAESGSNNSQKTHSSTNAANSSNSHSNVNINNNVINLLPSGNGGNGGDKPPNRNNIYIDGTCGDEYTKSTSKQTTEKNSNEDQSALNAEAQVFTPRCSLVPIEEKDETPDYDVAIKFQCEGKTEGYVYKKTSNNGVRMWARMKEIIIPQKVGRNVVDIDLDLYIDSLIADNSGKEFQIGPNIIIKIFNTVFHDKATNDIVYFVANQLNSQKKYKWRIDRVMTAREILSEYTAIRPEELTQNVITPTKTIIKKASLPKKPIDDIKVEEQKEPSSIRKHKTQPNSDLSYESNNTKTIQSSIHMSRKMKKETIPGKIGETVIDMKHYLYNMMAINGGKEFGTDTGRIKIFNTNLHEEKEGSIIYCIAKPVNPTKNRQYKWRMNEVMTAHEIKNKYLKINICELPKCNIVELSNKTHENKIKHTIAKPSRIHKIINKAAWQKETVIPVFGSHACKWKRSLTLSLQRTEFINQLQCKQCLQNNSNNIQLIPIIIFEQNKPTVNYVHIVTIDDEYQAKNIGISFRCEGKNNEVKITGIHCDAECLKKQYQLVSPQWDKEIHNCLDNFTSNITNIKIYGNPDHTFWRDKYKSQKKVIERLAISDDCK